MVHIQSRSSTKTLVNQSELSRKTPDSSQLGWMNLLGFSSRGETIHYLIAWRVIHPHLIVSPIYYWLLRGFFSNIRTTCIRAIQYSLTVDSKQTNSSALCFFVFALNQLYLFYSSKDEPLKLIFMGVILMLRLSFLL